MLGLEISGGLRNGGLRNKTISLTLSQTSPGFYMSAGNVFW